MPKGREGKAGMDSYLKKETEKEGGTKKAADKNYTVLGAYWGLRHRAVKFYGRVVFLKTLYNYHKFM